MKKKTKKKISTNFLNKKKLITILILAIVVISLSYLFLFKGLDFRTKVHSNTTELYSLFTPLMEEHVNSYLQIIDCKPNEYYYYNSSVCLVCNEMEVCFEYGWVNIDGEEKMNPQTPIFLKGKYNKEEELNFYSKNFAGLLNCKCDGECICDDGIKPRIENYFVIFTFPENINIKQWIEEFAKKTKVSECTLTDLNIERDEDKVEKAVEEGYRFMDSSFSCGNISGVIASDEIIFGVVFEKI